MDEIIYWKSIPVSLENSKSFSGKLFRYPIPSGCSYVKAMMELFSGHRGCVHQVFDRLFLFAWLFARTGPNAFWTCNWL